MILTAILLGLAGSLHCIFMCSPLAIAVTRGGGISRKLLYNGGRILTYAILGALVAMFGHLLSLSGFQFTLTILVALGLILMGISGMTGLKIPGITSVMSQLTLFIKKSFGRFIESRRYHSIFLLGMVNGLLPCGVTYLALTYCLTLDGGISGFNFMLWFGSGTLPAMLGLTSILSALVQRFSINATRVTRYSYIAIGLLVVGRLMVSNHTEIADAVNQGVILLCQ